MKHTPGHAEREVERARADLSHTLDALRGKLTLGQMFDEARAQFMGGGEFTSNLARQVRENPLPVAMIGLGALLLMMGERQRARSPAVRVHPGTERAQRVAREAGAGLSSTAESAREAGESAAERARAAAAGAGESVRSMTESVGDTMRHAGDSAAALMHQARGAAQSAGESAGEMRQRTMRGINDMLDQQPLLIGAIGAALGALIGAVLPSTRTEDELLGETRDQLRDTLAEQGGQLYEKGKVTATEVYRAASEEARDQGLVPEGTGDRTLAEKTEQVVTKAGEAAKETGQREMGAAEKKLGGEAGKQAAPGTPAGSHSAGGQATQGIKPGAPAVPNRPAPSPPMRKS